MTTALATADNIDRYVAEISRFPLLTREQEAELAAQYRRTGDVSAAHRLVVSNLRFVVKIAHEYKGYGLRLSDLIQEGNVGLMIAVKKFDPAKGYRLISYAVWWIRATIQAFLLRSWSLVKIGTTRAQRKLFFRLRSETVKAIAESADGRTTSTQELAERLNVDETEIEQMEGRMAARDFSLDAKMSEASTKTYVDSLVSQDAQPDEELSRLEDTKLLAGKVHEVVEGLDERDRFIVENRLMSDEPKTLQEIGDAFHVTRERARQLESKIIAKLRTSMARAGAVAQA